MLVGVGVDVTIKVPDRTPFQHVQTCKRNSKSMEKLFLAAQYKLSSYTIHTKLHIKLMVKLMIIKTRVFNPLAATRIRVKVVSLLSGNLSGHPSDQRIFFKRVRHT